MAKKEITINTLYEMLIQGEYTKEELSNAIGKKTRTVEDYLIDVRIKACREGYMVKLKDNKYHIQLVPHKNQKLIDRMKELPQRMARIDLINWFIKEYPHDTKTKSGTLIKCAKEVGIQVIA